MSGNEENINGNEMSVKVSEEMSKKNPCHIETDTLLGRLHLQDKLQQKLAPGDFLQIRPSVKQHHVTSEKDLAHPFLSRLIMLDYRARYIPVRPKGSEGTHPKPVRVIDITENEFNDLDALLSTSVERHKEEQTHVHPMDVQMAVFHCSDSFLKQMMITKLSQCQYALPLLVPDPVTKEIECPLWTFRQITKTWKVTQIKDDSNIVTRKSVPVCKAETPLVSFFRLGSLSVSKSQLMNTLINDHHSTFFHRNCPGSTKSRYLMDGVAEIAWYCPAGKPNDAFSDCIAFCNLHGDALLIETQRDTLIEKSSINIFLVASLQKHEESRLLISDLFKSHKPLICLCVDDSCDVRTNTGKYIMGLKDRSQAEVSEDLKQIIREVLSSVDGSSLKLSFQLETMAELSGIRVDESDPACQKGKSAAMKIMDLLTKDNTDVSKIKNTFLPCQGRLWNQWSKIQKELYHLRGDSEMEKSKKQQELMNIRQKQCAASCSKLMELFTDSLSSFLPTEKEYFLKWTQILMDALSTGELSSILQSYDETWSEVLALKNKHNKSDLLLRKQTDLEEISRKLQSATFGLEHIFREMGQIYEAHRATEGESRHTDWSKYPELAAQLMISGHPVELMDGDAGHVPSTWISSLLEEVIKKLGDQRVFVLSVLGIQSSGKSTMLNTMFGLQFAVSAGRCTKGAFMQLLKVSEEMKKDFKFDFVLVLDTEGLSALELDGNTTHHHDNELATFVVGLANLTLINIFGENPSEMQDILQIVVQVFIRMKKVKLSPSCVFVHQNVTDVAAAEKNMDGKRRLQEKLDQMAKLAAKEEVYNGECFNDVIEFDVRQDVKYCAQLWEGSPPMAAPNPGYSESIQEVKNIILSKASRSAGITLSQFKTKVQDLWNALLNENFVFSFENTLEIAVYRKLEAHYGNWTWTLRSNMLTIENQLHHRIENGNLNKVEVSYLKKESNKAYETIKKEMTTYFEEDKDKEMLAQWKGRFESKIKMFHDEQVSTVKRKLDEIIQKMEARKKLDDKKRDFEDKLLQKSRELARQLKDKVKDEEELKKQFSSVWKGWVTELTTDTKPVKDINLEEDQFTVLQELGFEETIINKCKQSGKYKKISEVGDYSDYVKPSKHLGFLPNNVLPHEKQEQIRSLIGKAVNESIDAIKHKPAATRGYTSSYLQEVAKTVKEEVEKFQKERKYNLKKEFTVDLSLCVFYRAESWLLDSQKKFQMNNDVLTYLESKKTQYYTVFRSSCKGNSSAIVLGELICEKLKTSIVEAVCNRTAINLAGMMRSNFPAFNGNRLNLEKHLLQSLAEKEDFDDFITYIRNPRRQTEAFIKAEVEKYIFIDHKDETVNILKKNIKNINTLVSQALSTATQKVLTHEEDTEKHEGQSQKAHTTTHKEQTDKQDTTTMEEVIQKEDTAKYEVHTAKDDTTTQEEQREKEETATLEGHSEKEDTATTEKQSQKKHTTTLEEQTGKEDTARQEEPSHKKDLAMQEEQINKKDTRRHMEESQKERHQIEDTTMQEQQIPKMDTPTMEGQSQKEETATLEGHSEKEDTATTEKESQKEDTEIKEEQCQKKDTGTQEEHIQRVDTPIKEEQSQSEDTALKEEESEEEDTATTEKQSQRKHTATREERSQKDTTKQQDQSQIEDIATQEQNAKENAETQDEQTVKEDTATQEEISHKKYMATQKEQHQIEDTAMQEQGATEDTATSEKQSQKEDTETKEEQCLKKDTGTREEHIQKVNTPIKEEQSQSEDTTIKEEESEEEDTATTEKQSQRKHTATLEEQTEKEDTARQEEPSHKKDLAMQEEQINKKDTRRHMEESQKERHQIEDTTMQEQQIPKMDTPTMEGQSQKEETATLEGHSEKEGTATTEKESQKEDTEIKEEQCQKKDTGTQEEHIQRVDTPIKEEQSQSEDTALKEEESEEEDTATTEKQSQRKHTATWEEQSQKDTTKQQEQSQIEDIATQEQNAKKNAETQDEQTVKEDTATQEEISHKKDMATQKEQHQIEDTAMQEQGATEDTATSEKQSQKEDTETKEEQCQKKDTGTQEEHIQKVNTPIKEEQSQSEDTTIKEEESEEEDTATTEKQSQRKHTATLEEQTEKEDTARQEEPSHKKNLAMQEEQINKKDTRRQMEESQKERHQIEDTTMQEQQIPKMDTPTMEGQSQKEETATLEGHSEKEDTATTEKESQKEDTEIKEEQCQKKDTGTQEEHIQRVDTPIKEEQSQSEDTALKEEESEEEDTATTEKQSQRKHTATQEERSQKDTTKQQEQSQIEDIATQEQNAKENAETQDEQTVKEDTATQEEISHKKYMATQKEQHQIEDTAMQEQGATEDTATSEKQSQKEDTETKEEQCQKKDTGTQEEHIQKVNTPIKEEQSQSEDTTIKEEESEEEDTATTEKQSQRKHTTTLEEQTEKEDTARQEEPSHKKNLAMQEEQINKKDTRRHMEASQKERHQIEDTTMQEQQIPKMDTPTMEGQTQKEETATLEGHSEKKDTVTTEKQSQKKHMATREELSQKDTTKQQEQHQIEDIAMQEQNAKENAETQDEQTVKEDTATQEETSHKKYMATQKEQHQIEDTAMQEQQGTMKDTATSKEQILKMDTPTTEEQIYNEEEDTAITETQSQKVDTETKEEQRQNEDTAPQEEQIQKGDTATQNEQCQKKNAETQKEHKQKEDTPTKEEPSKKKDRERHVEQSQKEATAIREEQTEKEDTVTIAEHNDKEDTAKTEKQSQKEATETQEQQSTTQEEQTLKEDIAAQEKQSQDEETVMQEQNLKESTATEEQSQTNHTDAWLKEFSCLLKDELTLDSISSQNFSDINDFEFLRDEIKKGFASIIEHISSLSLDILKESRLKADEILIDQLCQCCWVMCPFCAAVCTNTIEDHNDADHSVPFHRPDRIKGWHHEGTEEFCINFCTTNIESDRSFYPHHNSEHSVPYKQYRTAGENYASWRIAPGESTVAYWKWFLCQFQNKLEEYYKLKFQGSGAIPLHWRTISKSEAIASLDEIC